jgi:hypothetical protein
VRRQLLRAAQVAARRQALRPQRQQAVSRQRDPPEASPQSLEPAVVVVQRSEQPGAAEERSGVEPGLMLLGALREKQLRGARLREPGRRSLPLLEQAAVVQLPGSQPVEREPAVQQMSEQ